MVLRAIRAVVPDFRPPMAVCETQSCTVPLLRAFYTPVSEGFLGLSENTRVAVENVGNVYIFGNSGAGAFRWPKGKCTNHTRLLCFDFVCQESHVSYPKLDFTAQDLWERFQKQLAMEAANTVTIESVEKKPVTERTVQAVNVAAGCCLGLGRGHGEYANSETRALILRKGDLPTGHSTLGPSRPFAPRFLGVCRLHSVHSAPIGKAHG